MSDKQKFDADDRPPVPAAYKPAFKDDPQPPLSARRRAELEGRVSPWTIAWLAAIAIGLGLAIAAVGYVVPRLPAAMDRVGKAVEMNPVGAAFLAIVVFAVAITKGMTAAFGVTKKKCGACGQWQRPVNKRCWNCGAHFYR